MSTLHIEHAISDFTTWKTAFDRFAAIRVQSGVRSHHIQRPVSDPGYIVIDLDFDSSTEAAAFLKFLQEKVWSSRENSPALAGDLRTAILEPVEKEAAMWQPDGWDATWRIGVLVPHADVGPEAELHAMAPPEVSIHATRVPFGGIRAGGEMDPTIPLAPVRAFAEPPYVDDATELLAAAPIHAIAFGFTSSAYVVGRDGEAAMLERLRTRSRGLPVVAPCASIVAALAVLGPQRVALFDPPWFDAQLNALGAAYYKAAGFDVVSSERCALPSDQSAIEPTALFEFVRRHVPAQAEAVIFGGNGFRVAGIIDALERELARPVVSPNQALLWAAMRAAGARTDAITRYGRLFAS